MRGTRSPASPAGEPPGHSRKSLATGFQNVDRSGDTFVFNRCLDLIAGISFFRDVKEESYRIISGASPGSVLDAGCGVGTDIATLVPLLPLHCQVFGMDASKSLLARAAERTGDCRGRCPLILGDITTIPCRNGVFGACRVDRVLQHIREPERAIQELVRVTAPGGILVAFDNDWDTFRFSLDDRELVAVIARFWRDSFASGRIGRNLPGLFVQSGLGDVRAEPRKLVLNDFSVAAQVFDLPDLIDRTEQAGVLAPAEASEVRTELRCRAKEGTFSSGYTGFLVQGTKPE